MSVNVENIAITSIENIVVFDLSDEYIGTLDELNDAKLSQDMEKVDITGARGAKLFQMKRNKTVTGSASNGLFSLPIAAADLGTEIKRNQTTTFRWKETLTVNSNAAELSYTPAGDSGSEIFGLYSIDVNGVCTRKFEQTANAPATGEFKVTNKAIAFFAGDLADDTKVVVWYDRTIDGATVISNLADEYAKDVHMILNCIGESPDCSVYYVQIDVPRASLSGSFDVGGGDSQTMHDIQWEALASKCGGGTNKFWDYIVVDDDIIDEPEDNK